MTSGTESITPSNIRLVFEAITDCPNVQTCLDGNSAHPCYKIVASQNAATRSEFQVPEPWVGRIDVAPILFLSSNPSIGEDAHATGATPPEQIWESHQLAFGGGSRTYIIDGVKTTRPNGTPIKNVGYWISVRARAKELIPQREVVPGVDYALTEVVHCKAKDEYGVNEALDECFGRFMERVWAVAAAKVVVVFGKMARQKLLGAGAEQPTVPLERTLGGRSRTLVFLPHPNAIGPLKTFAENYSAADLSRLKALINGAAATLGSGPS